MKNRTKKVPRQRRIGAVADAMSKLATEVEVITTIDNIGFQLRRLNENLEAGRLSIRTHHPLCIAPPDGDYSVRQLEAISKFVNQSIASGALVLPAKAASEEPEVSIPEAGGEV